MSFCDNDDEQSENGDSKKFKSPETLRSDINQLQKSLYGIDLDLFASIFTEKFNIFEFYEKVGDLSMLALTEAALDYYGLIKPKGKSYLDYNCFSNFISKVRLNYLNNPYHNQLHAMDVLQTTLVMITKLNFEESFSDLDLSAILISALLHDIGHPGLNNSYQINKQTKLSLRYNDKSVLENHHCSLGFKILNEENSNLLSNLSKEEYKLFRKRCIEMILSTDMTQHSNVISAVQYKIDVLNSKSTQVLPLIKGDDEQGTVSDIDETSLLEQLLDCKDKSKRFQNEQGIMNFIIHLADISNPTKSVKIYEKWANRVTEEFFAQGDLEKKEGLEISFLCNRETVNIQRGQIGFISSIVIPSFKILSSFSKKVKYLEENAEENKRALIWL